MYFVTKRTIVIENETVVQFGISDGIYEFPCLSSEKEEAEKLAALLNENGVEAIHVRDIIEDMFYT